MVVDPVTNVNAKTLLSKTNFQISYNVDVDTEIATLSRKLSQTHLFFFLTKILGFTKLKKILIYTKKLSLQNNLKIENIGKEGGDL